MLTILFGLLGAGAVFTVLYRMTEIGMFWSVILGIVGFMVVQLIISLLLRMKMKKINLELQQVMLGTQKNLERKQQMFIRQRNTNQTMMRMQMEAEQKKGIEEALKVCEPHVQVESDDEKTDCHHADGVSFPDAQLG